MFSKFDSLITSLSVRPLDSVPALLKSRPSVRIVIVAVFGSSLFWNKTIYLGYLKHVKTTHTTYFFGVFLGAMILEFIPE